MADHGMCINCEELHRLEYQIYNTSTWTSCHDNVNDEKWISSMDGTAICGFNRSTEWEVDKFLHEARTQMREMMFALMVHSAKSMQVYGPMVIYNKKTLEEFELDVKRITDINEAIADMMIRHPFKLTPKMIKEDLKMMASIVAHLLDFLAFCTNRLLLVPIVYLLVLTSLRQITCCRRGYHFLSGKVTRSVETTSSITNDSEHAKLCLCMDDEVDPSLNTWLHQLSGTVVVRIGNNKTPATAWVTGRRQTVYGQMHSIKIYVTQTMMNHTLYTYCHFKEKLSVKCELANLTQSVIMSRSDQCALLQHNMNPDALREFLEGPIVGIDPDSVGLVLLYLAFPTCDDHFVTE